MSHILLCLSLNLAAAVPEIFLPTINQYKITIMKRRELVGKMTALASGGFLLSAPDAKAAGTEAVSYTTIYDVRKYGAKADGKTNDAAAIQKAIDACHKGGGGVVLLDKGVYLSGGIKLRNHV